MTQHCQPPYRAFGYSYTYRIYVFKCRKVSSGPYRTDVSDDCSIGGGGAHGGLSQVNAALCKLSRYRGPGVSRLYCHKSRLNGSLREKKQQKKIFDNGAGRLNMGTAVRADEGCKGQRDACDD